AAQEVEADLGAGYLLKVTFCHPPPIARSLPPTATRPYGVLSRESPSATCSHQRSCNRGCRPVHQHSSRHRQARRIRSPLATRPRWQAFPQLERLCAWRHSRCDELTFCNANNAPVGSVTTAMVPSRSSGDGGKMTLPPSAATRAAADTGSSTPKYV